MVSLPEMLEKLRLMPALLGRPSVTALYAFLAGFAYSRKENHPEDYKILSAFGNYVHRRYEIYSTQSWAQIIDSYSLSDEDSLRLFWKRWDEYCARKAKARKNGSPALSRNGRKRKAV